MKQAISLLVLLFLIGCDRIPGTQASCDKAANEVNAKWEPRHPTSKDEVREEIKELLPDNQCGSITPWRVRKIMNDILAARQCSSPEIKAKIASYRTNDSNLLREIAIDVADCQQ